MNIFDFENSCPSAKKQIEYGRNAYASGKVVSLESEDLYTFKACMKQPYAFVVQFTLDGDANIIESSCNCPVGNSENSCDTGKFCEHQLAAFFELREPKLPNPVSIQVDPESSIVIKIDKFDLSLNSYCKDNFFLKLSNIAKLMDYDYNGGKFYRQHAEEFSDRIPIIADAVNSYMLQDRQHGILDHFNLQARAAAQFPFCGSFFYINDEDKKTPVDFVPYSRHKPLREFLTNVVKYTENIMRSKAGFRGRLDAEIQELDIAGFIESQFLIIAEEAEERRLTDPKVLLDLFPDVNF